MTNTFNEGVRPGGLTSSTELKILLCHILDSVDIPVAREQLEDVLLGEELVNYFVLAEGISQLKEQGLITERGGMYRITEAGRRVGHDLADDLPRTVREAAIRGIIKAQQFAAKAAVNNSEVTKTKSGYQVRCSIGDAKGPLFGLDIYMPNATTAQVVQKGFVENGDEVYKLVLAALTRDTQLADKALEALRRPHKP